MKRDDVLKSIKESGERMVRRVEGWSNINSGSRNVEGLKEMLWVLEREFREVGGGFEVREVGEGRSVLVGKCREWAPVQVFLNGHYDTVYGPGDGFLRCRREGGKLMGPGVADMKGGLVVLLEALRGLERFEGKGRVGWQVFLNPDEEIGSPYSSELMLESARGYDLGLIFEPSLPDGYIVGARKGSGVLEVESYGVAAHAGRNFGKGRNAIGQMARYLVEVDELNKEFLGAIFNIGEVRGGGVLNIVPDKAEAKVNIRVSSEEEKERILWRLEEMGRRWSGGGYRMEYKVRFSSPPKERTKGVEWMFECLREGGRELGIELGWRDSGGASDGNRLAASGLVNIDNLGVRGDNIHTHEEYLIEESLVERAQLTAGFLMSLAKGRYEIPREIIPRKSYEAPGH